MRKAREALESIADLVDSLVNDLEATTSPGLPADRVINLRAAISRARGSIARVPDDSTDLATPPTPARRRPNQRKL